MFIRLGTGKICSQSVLFLGGLLRKLYVVFWLDITYLILSVSMVVCSTEMTTHAFSNIALACSLLDAIHHSREPSWSPSNNCACKWYQCIIQILVSSSSYLLWSIYTGA